MGRAMDGSDALLMKTIFASVCCNPFGVNVTVNTALPPAGRVFGNRGVTTRNTDWLENAREMLTLAEPVLVIVQAMRLTCP